MKVLNSITQEEVRDLFEYVDGDLIRRKTTGSRALIGNKVGGVTKHGYMRVVINYREYFVHLLVFLWHHGYIPENDVDHIDRNKLNNRIENLREVSRVCNQRNRDLARISKSGVPGVRRDSSRNKYVVTIGNASKGITLGRFNDFTEAVAHRLAAEQALGWPGCHSDSPSFLFMENYRK